MTEEETNPTGPPRFGVKRALTPDPGFEECYECGGDGACYLCRATGRYDNERCFNCNGSRRCIVCQGSGQIAAEKPAAAPARSSGQAGPVFHRCPVCGSDRVRGGHARIDGASVHDFFCAACQTLESKRDDEDDYQAWRERWIDHERTRAGGAA